MPLPLKSAAWRPAGMPVPIHQRAQGYLALVAEGRFADAYRTILEDNPFPSICGRVCNHRCEEACNRAQVDAPVNIMAHQALCRRLGLGSIRDEATAWLKNTADAGAGDQATGRQAGGDRRRRPGWADLRPGPGRAGLRGDRLRGLAGARWHDARGCAGPSPAAGGGPA